MFNGIKIVLIGFLLAAVGIFGTMACFVLEVCGAITMSKEACLVPLAVGLGFAVVLLIVGGIVHVNKMSDML